MRDAQHDKPPDCDDCAAAEANPLSGLYRQGCPRCAARHAARLPPHVRQEAERKAAEAGRLERLAEWVEGMRGACASETTYTKTGDHG